MDHGPRAWLEPPPHQPQSHSGLPAIPAHIWRVAGGRGTVVNFSFSPRFFEAMAKEVGLSGVIGSGIGTIFFRSISAQKPSFGS
jgi:hypothetical protein